MRKICFADHLEKKIADALDKACIEFVHESEVKKQILDFYLPFFDVYIEVKQFHTDRISGQMSSKENIIAVQGNKSVDFFIKLINDNKINNAII